ncbi:MAG TPA: cytidylate kinase-like family protein [Candidatus Eisenbacteria bacterium]|jgi:cytidylate kinase
MRSSIDSIIDRQLRRWEHERQIVRSTGPKPRPRPEIQPVITVSRHHGTRGSEIAAGLAERFGYTLLHRDIIDRMSENAGFTRRLLESFDEHAPAALTSWFDSILVGTYVDASDYVRALLRVVHSVAELGGVVVVGRGANFIIGPDRGFHVRIVAPRGSRIRNLVARKGISERDAGREVDARDHERAEFTRRLFGRNVGDPLAYDMIVNEAGLPPDAIVPAIAQAAAEKIKQLRGRSTVTA